MSKELTTRKRVYLLAVAVPAVLYLCVFAGCSRSKDVNENEIVVANAGFESGTMEPWHTFQAVKAEVSSNRAHGGKFSLKETMAPGSAYEDVAGLQPGTEYEISGWISADPGTSAPAQLATYDIGAATTSTSPATVPNQDWQMIKHRVKLSASGKLRVHLFLNAGNGTIYWDDIKIEPVQ